MQGPPLTRREVADLLRGEVDQLESLGAKRPNAITAVADRHGVDAQRVESLIGGTSTTGTPHAA